MPTAPARAVVLALTESAAALKSGASVAPDRIAPTTSSTCSPSSWVSAERSRQLGVSVTFAWEGVSSAVPSAWPPAERVRVSLAVGGVGLLVVLRRVLVGLVEEVVDVVGDALERLLLAELAVRVVGEEVGQLVLVLGHLQLGLCHRGLVAGAEPPGVVEQPGHVPGPQRRERLGGVGAELGREQLAERVGVLADRGVRGLRHVRVVADPAAHHVRREHGVLAEQGLELQRELARGDRTAGRLGPGQAAVGAAVGVAGAGRERERPRPPRGWSGRRPACLSTPRHSPATRAMATTEAPSRSSRDSPLRVRPDSLTARTPTLRLPTGPGTGRNRRLPDVTASPGCRTPY